MTSIAIAGGSGFLGRALAAALRRDGSQVSVLTRRPSRDDDVAWSPGAPGAWRDHVRQADVVVNLAGESMAAARWTPKRKALLRGSRIGPTEALVREIVESPHRPVLLSASAIGYYGTRGDEILTEDSPPGNDFLASLCVEWEAATRPAAAVTRVVLLRTGIVLSRRGGALPPLAAPFHFFLGGPIGSGRQYVSWIHLRDWVSLVRWAMSNDRVEGPLNLTAPNPVTNAELAAALSEVLRRPAVFRMPAFAMRLAVGEMADAAILNGQRVVPAKALAGGFQFAYERIGDALRAIYAS